MIGGQTFLKFEFVSSVGSLPIILITKHKNDYKMKISYYLPWVGIMCSYEFGFPNNILARKMGF